MEAGQGVQDQERKDESMTLTAKEQTMNERPTPWQVTEAGGAFFIDDANMKTIVFDVDCEVGCRIVKAVNAHDALHHACFTALSLINALLGENPERPVYDDETQAVKEIEAAIALARGSTAHEAA